MIPCHVLPLEDTHDNSPQENEDETYGKKFKLPYHGHLLLSQDVVILPQTRQIVQGGISLQRENDSRKRVNTCL